MANKVHGSQDLHSGDGDAIRIVPLYLPDTPRQPMADAVVRAVAVPPKLTYRKGPLLTAVEVFTLFWGSAWQQAKLAPVAVKVNTFFDFILTSPLIDRLAEYNVPGKKIGHGKRTGTATVVSAAVTSVTDTAIRHMLQNEIAHNAFVPPVGTNTLYFVYLPPGVRVVQGGAASCQAFCGYHNDVSGKLFYAVMPYPGCAGCLGGMNAFDALTATSSHELCEAITDPVPGQGWYDDTHGEIGDICAWKTAKLGPYTVQLEWSNRAKGCS
jgi:hypothetical protein